MGQGSKAAALAVIGACAMLTAGPTLAASQAAPPLYLETPLGAKPRVVITADPELDDNNSLLRYLLYADDFRTEGLIYASSQYHWKGDGKGTKGFVPGREYTRAGRQICPCTSWRWDPKERFIDAALDAYAKAYPNLKVHDPAYPTPATLRSKVRWGNVAFDGEMSKDTDGSNLIKTLLLDKEEAPVYLHAWGGQSTIARALKSIEEQYKGAPQWAAIRAKVIRKAVIHPSGDQDDTYANYIKPNWPEIRYVLTKDGVMLSYLSQRTLSQDDAAYMSADWTKANVSDKGPLGALYRTWGDGRQMVKGDIFDYFGEPGKTAEQLRAEGFFVWSPIEAKGSAIGEGDTVTFLNLIGNGLEGYRANSFGGWGGYHDVERKPMTFDLGGPPPELKREPTHPFLAQAQHDFAARFVWATTSRYADANHAPKITVNGARLITARPGQAIALSASAIDPDQDKVSVRWWNWTKAGTYAEPVELRGADTATVQFTAPLDAKPGDTLHLIAEATDDGAPALTRYAHVVVTIVR